MRASSRASSRLTKAHPQSAPEAPGAGEDFLPREEYRLRAANDERFLRDLREAAAARAGGARRPTGAAEGEAACRCCRSPRSARSAGRRAILENRLGDLLIILEKNELSSAQLRNSLSTGA